MKNCLFEEKAVGPSFQRDWIYKRRGQRSMGRS